jgi:hypothetical protein
MNVQEILEDAKTDCEKMGAIQGTLMGMMLALPKGDPMREQLELAYQYAMELTIHIVHAENSH